MDQATMARTSGMVEGEMRVVVGLTVERVLTVDVVVSEGVAVFGATEVVEAVVMADGN